MTVQEIITQTWELLGSPRGDDTILDVSDNFDITATGSVRFLKWLNNSYIKLINYMYASGHMLRLQNLHKTMYIRTPEAETITVSGVTNNYTFACNDASSSTDDWYVGYVIKDANGKYSSVYDYTGSTDTFFVVPSFSTTPVVADSMTLYPTYYRMDGTGESFIDEVLIPLTIYNMTDKETIELASRTEIFEALYEQQPGEPDEYMILDDKIYFDRPFDEEKVLKLEYIAQPAALTGASDEPQIPVQYHRVLVLDMLWYGYKRAQEHRSAWSVAQDIEREMNTLRKPNDLAHERINPGLRVRANRYG